ncbi:MAG: fluoride efflux transporter FluC [Thermodesulfobacteriota bacterium]
MKFFWLLLAGGLGTLARYSLGGAVQRAYGGGFPWGTFAVNILGCFLFGVLWSVAEERLVISGEVRTVILVGFMGAFTTFSTFIFETGQFVREAQWLLAMGNVLLQSVSGIIVLFIGFAAGRLL